MKKRMFSYYIVENGRDNACIPFGFPIERKFGKYIIRTDESTPYDYSSEGDVACAILGLSVDVISGSSTDLAQKIVACCKSIQDFVDFERRLGGKYLLLFRVKEQYYLQGDATCSIPVFYNTEGPLVCSCFCQGLADAKGFERDDELFVIRQSADISQAMPYDITSYKQIKQLIPNHYLDMNTQRAVRFVNSACKQETVSAKRATEIVLPMIENLLAFYQRKFKIYCPITSGRDSRVVLSFLMKNNKNFGCYTIKHPEHGDHAQDIIVPVALCQKIGVEHRLVEDIAVPDSLRAEMDALLGEGNYSQKTLRIAATVKEYFGDGAIINGDIIGQVGKCSLHRDIPERFASPTYFRCKLHNYSKGAKEYLELWLKEIKASSEQVNSFDLFSVENRMGRWAGQENLMYNSLGQLYLNIFNSRSIIYIWTAVARAQRKRSELHMGLIRKTFNELTGIPFGRDEGVAAKLSKLTGITYLIASYVKFYVEKIKFEKG